MQQGNIRRPSILYKRDRSLTRLRAGASGDNWWYQLEPPSSFAHVVKSSSSSGPNLHSWYQKTPDNNLRSISEKLRFLDFDLQTFEAGVKPTWERITHEPSINADDGCFRSFHLRRAVVHGKLVSIRFWRLGQIVESRPTNVMEGDYVLQTAWWWILTMGTLGSLVRV